MIPGFKDSRILPGQDFLNKVNVKLNQQERDSLDNEFTSEELEIEHVRAASQAYREANRRAIRLSAAFVPLIRMAILVGFTATLLHGGLVTLNGGMEVASYSVMIFMMQRLLWPLTRLGETFDLYQRAMVSTTRVLNLLETEISVQEGDKELDITKVKGDIRFDDINFAYPERDEVISNLSLAIKPGTTQAIVGSTGSGKTTLIRLLLRFHDPSSGSISLDGDEIKDLRVKSLRSSISLVTQTIILFPGTVMQNIAYGRVGATEEEIITHSRNNLAHFKCPKKVIFGSIPKTSTGKIQKFLLRQKAKKSQP